MPRVALFARTFGEYSETFIYDELRQHTRYQADVFCLGRVNDDLFPWQTVYVDSRRSFRVTARSHRWDRIFRSRDYALIHAHFGNAAVYMTGYAARFDLPLIVTFHGYDVPLLSSYDTRKKKHRRYARLAPKMLEQMTLGICASLELKEMLTELGVPEGKLAVNRLGIDLSAFRPGAAGCDLLQVVMVGRLVPKKGFEYGLRAFAQSVARRPMRLVIAGGGELEGKLRELVSSLGITEHVHMAGVLTSADVAELLHRSDVILCPSAVTANGNRESGLLVAKEASACETVPIGTWHGGLPEIIEDGVTGYLVPERDVEALTERLLSLESNRELLRRMGRAARRKMELEYDNRERVAALELLYDEQLSRHAERAQWVDRPGHLRLNRGRVG